MPTLDKDYRASDGLRAGLFLANDARAQDVSAALVPGGITATVNRQTRDGATFLNGVDNGEMMRLDLVVLDLEGQSKPVSLAREVVGRTNPGTPVIAIGNTNDVGLYRSLRQAGVCDYLLQPVSGPALLQAVDLALGRQSQAKNSCTVAFYATHGGCGAGLLAAGTAACIAKKFGRSTLCGDSDFASPSAGNHLGVDKAGELAMLLRAGERLDVYLVQQVARPVRDNLILQNSFDPMYREGAADFETAEKLLEEFDQLHRYQVWRVAGTNALTRAILLHADIVYVVVTGSLASATAGQYIHSWLSENNPRALVSQVYNNISPKSALSPEMLSQVTGRPNRVVIPWKKGLSGEIATNRSLEDQRHCLNREFTKIAQEIVGNVREAPKGLFARWKR